MKQLLLILCFLLSLSNLRAQSYDGQTIRVKIRPELQSKYSISNIKLSGKGYTQLGDSKLDKLNERLKVVSYRRVFSDSRYHPHATDIHPLNPYSELLAR